MILRLFKSNQPFTAIFVVLLAILLWLPGLFYPISWNPSEAFLAEPLFSDINKIPWLVHLLNLIFIVIGAIGLNSIFNRSEFHPKSNHLPAFFFVMIVALFLPFNSFHPVLPGIVLTLLALSFTLKVFRQNRVLHEYFMAGFWLGISGLIYLPLLGLFPFLIIAVLFTRAFNWRELLLPLIAGSIPMIYYLVFALFIKEIPIADLAEYTLPKLSERLRFSKEVGILLAVIIAVPSFLVYLRTYNFSSNRSRNTKSVFTILSIGFIVTCVTGVYYWRPATLTMLTIPLAVYYSLFFLEAKNKIITMTFLTLLFLVVIARSLHLLEDLPHLAIFN